MSVVPQVRKSLHALRRSGGRSVHSVRFATSPKIAAVVFRDCLRVLEPPAPFQTRAETRTCAAELSWPCDLAPAAGSPSLRHCQAKYPRWVSHSTRRAPRTPRARASAAHARSTGVRAPSKQHADRHVVCLGRGRGPRRPGAARLGGLGPCVSRRRSRERRLARTRHRAPRARGDPLGRRRRSRRARYAAIPTLRIPAAPVHAAPRGAAARLRFPTHLREARSKLSGVEPSEVSGGAPVEPRDAVARSQRDERGI